eukprot:scaffold1717_cov169-Amphora_coffeaeformis.AAC.6
MNNTNNNDATHYHHPSYNDLGFRPPVPLPQSCENSKQHDASIKSKMAMLLVCCQVLQLSMETTFTAACLLHRYVILDTTSYYIATETSQDIDESSTTDDGSCWPWTTACIIFIACKTEEEHRRLRDLINLARMLSFSPSSFNSNTTNTNNKNEPHPAASQPITTTTTAAITTPKEDNHHCEPPPLISLFWKNDPPKLDDDYWNDKERIVKAEQTVLRQLAFDVHVAHPHRLVVLLVEDCLADYWHSSSSNNNNDDEDDITLDKQQNIFTKTVVEDTWKLLNTCVFSVSALQQSTLALAVTALDLTLQQTESKPQIPAHWWKDATGLSPDSKDKATQVLQSVLFMS